MNTGEFKGFVNLEGAIQELQREYEMRKKVFPTWIANGKITQELADERCNNLVHAITYLIALRTMWSQMVNFDKV